MYGKLLEIENAVFPENIVFSQKNIVFFVGMTFSSVFEAPGIYIYMYIVYLFACFAYIYIYNIPRSVGEAGFSVFEFD